MYKYEVLSPIWKDLLVVLKRQNLTTLQRVLNNTSRRLSVRVPIVAMTSLLNITLSLGFLLDHRDNLGLGLHQFGLIQHTSAAWKVLKAPADKQRVIVCGGAAPSLEDADTLTAPYGLSLPATLAMAGGASAGLRLVIDTLLGHRAGHVVHQQGNPRMGDRYEGIKSSGPRVEGTSTYLDYPLGTYPDFILV